MRYDRISIHYALNIYWTFKYNPQKEGIRYAKNGRFVPYQTQLFSKQKYYSQPMDISGYHSQFDDYNEVTQMVLNDIERIKTDKDYKNYILILSILKRYVDVWIWENILKVK